jgi:PHS family inorganic phosphate transporter-like MFS transporter
MLACVFFCQPLGYCMATIVTMAALGGTGASPSRYRLDCAWRWVVGIGVFFAIIAAYFRRRVPESPWFTADILYRATEALQDYNTFNESQTDPDNLEACNTDEILPAPNTAHQVDAIPLQTFQGPSSENAETQGIADISNGIPSNSVPNSDVMSNGDTHLQTLHHTTDAANGYSGAVSTPEQTPRHAIDQSFESRWKSYWMEFGQNFPASFQLQTPTLVGVSVCWCMLDLIYYALLGPGSSRVVKLFITANNELLFASTWKVMILLIGGSLVGGLFMIFLVKNQSPRLLQMIGFATVTILILIFGVILIEVREDHAFHPLGIIFYFIASISFEVGANFTTFMLPAELFPTRHRAFAVGIAASSGKVGAVIIQPFVRYVTYHGKYGGASEDLGLAPFWVGFATISWIGAPIFGLLATYLLIPQTRLSDEGNANQPLDILCKLRTPMQDWLEERRTRGLAAPAAADESSRTSSE